MGNERERHLPALLLQECLLLLVAQLCHRQRLLLLAFLLIALLLRAGCDSEQEWESEQEIEQESEHASPVGRASPERATDTGKPYPVQAPHGVHRYLKSMPRHAAPSWAPTLIS